MAPTDEQLLIALANTAHGDVDELSGPAEFGRWLSAAVDSAPSNMSASSAELAWLRDIRAVIRDLALRNCGVEDQPRPQLPADLDLRLTWDGEPALVAAGSTSAAAELAGRVSLALVRASARPDWKRLKACRGADCRWVFIDRSKNCSRQWCIVAGCGNRAKVAAFRERQREAR